MRRALGVACLAGVWFAMLRPAMALDEVQLAFTELVGHGAVNVYSMSILVKEAFQAGTLDKERAADLASQNLAFAASLKKYATRLMREGSDADREDRRMLVDLSQACEYLHMQVEALKEFIEDDSKTALEAFERYRAKTEKLMDSALNR